MSTTFKCTFNFRYRTAGTSISLYTDAADHNAAATKAKILAPRLVSLCGIGTEIGALRVSDDDIPGDSSIGIDVWYCNTTSLGNVPNYTRVPPADAAVGPNDPNVALLVRTISDPTRRGHFFFHFLPDDYIKEGFFTPSQKFSTEMNLVFNLLNNNWSIKTTPKSTGNPRRVITAIASTGTSPNVVVITAPGHGLTGKKKVRVGKTKTVPNLNGVWTIASQTTDTVTLASSTAFAGVDWTGGGAIWSADQTVNPITAHQLAKITTRHAGRPFGLPVGRRRVRRK